MRAMTALPARAVALAGLSLLTVGAGLWAAGLMQPLADWATGQQKAVQSSLAGAVRALRAGEPGAWAALLTVCFSYGFFHAVGPGHGKAVIGSYAMARRVRLMPLVGLALASSLAQALVAIGLVAGGAFVFGWTRERMEGVAEAALLPLSHALVAGLGLWLVWRGARGLARMAPGQPRAARRGSSEAVMGQDGPHTHRQNPQVHPHDGHRHDAHHHHHAAEACDCGHAHGPSVEQVAQVTSARDAVLLVGAIALRPCSGALFLLILTFAIGIGWAGVAGTLAMALGTASVTITVAALAFATREGAWASLPGAGLARLLPVVELSAGALIAGIAMMLLIGSL